MVAHLNARQPEATGQKRIPLKRSEAVSIQNDLMRSLRLANDIVTSKERPAEDIAIAVEKYLSVAEDGMLLFYVGLARGQKRKATDNFDIVTLASDRLWELREDPIMSQFDVKWRTRMIERMNDITVDIVDASNAFGKTLEL